MEETITYLQKNEAKLQNEVIRFISQTKLILKEVLIVPKEIEVYFYKEGEFPDESVHRNELQQNNKNHFYVHRTGKLKNDRYKGGNRAGVEFVVSSEVGMYYSYLIRSAVVNNEPFYGPHKVLEAIRIASHLDYKEIEENEVAVETSDSFHDVIMSKRINIGRGFVNSELRAVILDNYFKTSKYRNKEKLITKMIGKKKMSKDEAIDFSKRYLGYIPTSIRIL